MIEGALRSMPEGTSHASSPELVEACLLRPWPGNVRELLAEVKAAALTASAAGRSTIAATDLDPRAGCALTAPAQAEAAPIEEGAEAPQPAAPRANVPSPPREVIAAALAEAGGNVLQTATRLGLSRARLRRLLERHAIDPRAVRDRKHGA